MVVVAEALDRVSRDQADVATLYRHLRFTGVMIVTLAEGEIDELHVGLKGAMNALFLKDLAAKTHRGLRGRVEAGKSGGGICYGYDVVKLHDAAGEPVRGERSIDETGVVRRTFREFAQGTSPRAIARRLNEDGIPGPKGRLWTDSVLRGHAKRGTGLLNNERYIGRLVWNRQRFMKNPDTGKWVARPNPPEEWIVAEVPELRWADAGVCPRACRPHGRALDAPVWRGLTPRAGSVTERRSLERLLEEKRFRSQDTASRYLGKSPIRIRFDPVKNRPPRQNIPGSNAAAVRTETASGSAGEPVRDGSERAITRRAPCPW